MFWSVWWNPVVFLLSFVDTWIYHTSCTSTLHMPPLGSDRGFQLNCQGITVLSGEPFLMNDDPKSKKSNFSTEGTRRNKKANCMLRMQRSTVKINLVTNCEAGKSTMGWLWRCLSHCRCCDVYSLRWHEPQGLAPLKASGIQHGAWNAFSQGYRVGTTTV